jgi:hypothetical protein
MAISERDRLELHLGLKQHLGDDMADILMEHLPPSGWADIVRQRDLDRFEFTLSGRMDNLEGHMDNLERSVDQLSSRLTFAISTGVAMFFTLLGLQVQLLLTLN